MIETRIGAVVAVRDGYRIAEIHEVLPHGGQRLIGYSLFGTYASAMIIYSSLPEAREALDDLLRSDPE